MNTRHQNHLRYAALAESALTKAALSAIGLIGFIVATGAGVFLQAAAVAIFSAMAAAMCTFCLVVNVHDYRINELRAWLTRRTSEDYEL